MKNNLLPFISDLKLAVLIAAVFAAVTPMPASWVESIYSQILYPFFQRVLTPLMNLVPFALFDFLIILLVGGLIILWIVSLWISPSTDRRRVTFSLIVSTGLVLALVYLSFLIIWGLNYRREPLREKLDYHQSRVTQEALLILAQRSVIELNRLYDRAHQTAWPELDRFVEVLSPAFEDAQQQLYVSQVAIAGRPKKSLFGFYFRWAGIDGMTNPFFLEILVNDEVLPFERPFVVAHEWAHLAGYADESEANFLGWRTCLAGNEAAQYSGWLFLFPQLLRVLPDDKRGVISEPLKTGPRQDLQSITSRLSQSSPVIRQSARKVYDGFLKANRVESGVASYGEVVELILGTGIISAGE